MSCLQSLNMFSCSLITLPFLPIVLALTSARRFKANEITAVALAGALVYPNIVELASAKGVTFFGIPVVMASPC